MLTLDTASDDDWGISYRTRTEKVMGGQRYRYGGDFLVPIEGPEGFNHDDIRKSGRNARTISKATASCDACGKESPAIVDFVVFLDKTDTSWTPERWVSRPPIPPSWPHGRR